MWNLSFPWWQFVFRGTIVYVALLVMLRLAGKREISQMGVGEFVAILLVSNAVQNSMNGGDISISGGLILSVVIIAISVICAYLTFRYPLMRRIIQGNPVILVRDGSLISDNLRKVLLSESELQTILREQGFHNIHEIEIAILESDGQVSVVRKGQGHQSPEEN